MECYKTVAGYGEAEITEKKSRFISHVSSALTEEEALIFIAKIKKKHYNARHNVFAYSIGLSEDIVKASDDGEPSGTAGVPILDILRKEKINNCVVVVTRYFGGTLLGTGGLVRAYSLAAKEGLKAAGVIERVQCVFYSLTADYNTYGKLQYELEKGNFKIESIAYTEAVTLNVIARAEREKELLKLAGDCSAGRVKAEKRDTAYYDLSALD